MNDLSGLFDEFFIDLSDIGGGSKEELDKIQLIQYFEGLLKGDKDSQHSLNQMVTESTNAQYIQGL